MNTTPERDETSENPAAADADAAPSALADTADKTGAAPDAPEETSRNEDEPGEASDADEEHAPAGTSDQNRDADPGTPDDTSAETDTSEAEPEAEEDIGTGEAPEAGDAGDDAEPDPREGLDLPLASVLEALLISAPEPRQLRDLARAAGRGVKPDEILAAMEELNAFYRESARAFEIVRIGETLRIMTCPEYAPFLQRQVKRPETKKLSPAALDTLAIVAYRQPIMRADIETIRGVGCGPVLRNLIELGLVEVAGRNDEVPGQPMLYGTTPRFLETFGVSTIEELPNIRDLRGD